MGCAPLVVVHIKSVEDWETDGWMDGEGHGQSPRVIRRQQRSMGLKSAPDGGHATANQHLLSASM